MTGFESKRNAAQDKLQGDDVQGYIAEYEEALLIAYQSGFADGKRSAQPEPTCPECKAAVLYECVACSSNNYPPAAKWDKPSASFNDWWDSNHSDPANPFAEGSAAYWAWAGWKAAQRPWQGMTDEAVEAIGDEVANETLIGPVPSFRQRFAQSLERALKEKNDY